MPTETPENNNNNNNHDNNENKLKPKNKKKKNRWHFHSHILISYRDTYILNIILYSHSHIMCITQIYSIRFRWAALNFPYFFSFHSVINFPFVFSSFLLRSLFSLSLGTILRVCVRVLFFLLCSWALSPEYNSATQFYILVYFVLRKNELIQANTQQHQQQQHQLQNNWI